MRRRARADGVAHEDDFPATPLRRRLLIAGLAVATAVTLGLRAGRAREKMTSGSVVDPGPDRKADSTTSSSEMVKVSSQADSSDCEIIGSVTSQNTCAGLAPRSMAASSSDGFRSSSRACTMTAA